MSKAFDNIIRERPIQMIEEVCGPECDIARMVKLHLGDINMTVKIGNETSESFIANTGTPQ